MAFKDQYFNESANRRIQDLGFLHQWLAEELKADKTTGLILDYGCGTGELVQLLQEELPRRRVFGIDINDLLIQDARTRYPSIANQLVTSINQLPGQGRQTISIVIFNFSLMFMRPFEKTILDLLKQLKIGSKIVVINPFPGERSRMHKLLDDEFYARVEDAKISPEHRILREQLNDSIDERSFDPNSTEKFFSINGFQRNRLIKAVEVKTYLIAESHKYYEILYDQLFLSEQERENISARLGGVISRETVNSNPDNIEFKSPLYILELTKRK